MMGLTVTDPDGIEGSISALPGLGLLPVTTVMSEGKTTRQVEFEFNGAVCRGYEIHQGRSDVDEAVVEADNCIGTYIHGFLDNPSVINYILRGRVKDIAVVTDVDEFRQQQYDKLAEHVRKYVDIGRIYKIMETDN